MNDPILLKMVWKNAKLRDAPAGSDGLELDTQARDKGGGVEDASEDVEGGSGTLHDIKLGGERSEAAVNEGLGGTTDLPRTHVARDQAKQGMGVRALNVLQGASERWAPAAELGLQVTPLEFELADGFEKSCASTRLTEFRAVESEAATQGLGVNVSEVGVDECDGVRPGLEAAKLGMMAIPARATLKDLASKERFPPERCEAPGIEISRVDGPESHDASLAA